MIVVVLIFGVYYFYEVVRVYCECFDCLCCVGGIVDCCEFLL